MSWGSPPPPTHTHFRKKRERLPTCARMRYVLVVKCCPDPPPPIFKIIYPILKAVRDSLTPYSPRTQGGPSITDASCIDPPELMLPEIQKGVHPLPGWLIKHSFTERISVFVDHFLQLIVVTGQSYKTPSTS